MNISGNRKSQNWIKRNNIYCYFMAHVSIKNFFSIRDHIHRETFKMIILNYKKLHDFTIKKKDERKAFTLQAPRKISISEVFNHNIQFILQKQTKKTYQKGRARPYKACTGVQIRRFFQHLNLLDSDFKYLLLE